MRSLLKYAFNYLIIYYNPVIAEMTFFLYNDHHL